MFKWDILIGIENGGRLAWGNHEALIGSRYAYR
jgi:hypothetical protein